jgi:glycosyltransferase 2 family protein
VGRASPQIAAASAGPAAAPARFKRAKTVAAYAVAVAALVWVFHDADPAELFRGVGAIRWDWVAAAVCFDILSYICQGLRWSLLLHPAGRISMWKTTQAVYAGLFANEILPLRVGEVLRIYLVRRWLNGALSAVVSAVLVERFCDAVWLGLAVGITILFVPLPRYLLGAEEILAGIVLCGTAIFVYLVVREERAAPAGEFATARGGGLFRSKLAPALGKLASGLRRIGRSRYFYGGMLLSGLLLLFQIVAFWLVLRAYGLGLSFWQGAAVLLIVHLGTAVPSAPSNIGTYQFFVVVGLTLLGVAKPVAAGFSVVVFVVLTAPLWVLGFFAVTRAGLSWRNLRSEVNTMVRQRAG